MVNDAISVLITWRGSSLPVWHGLACIIAAGPGPVRDRNLVMDPAQTPHNALDKYPTMHHFVTEMCTFLLQNGALWDMGLVHCGIFATGQFELWAQMSEHRTWAPLGLTLIPAWIRNFIAYFYWVCDYLSTLRLKSVRVSRKGLNKSNMFFSSKSSN